MKLRLLLLNLLCHFCKINGEDSKCSNRGVESANEIDSCRVSQINRRDTVKSTEIISPQIRPSLFPHVPPYLKFHLYSDKIEKLPYEVRKSLKWRIGTREEFVTIKATLKTSGLRLVQNSTSWIYIWDKFVKRRKFYRRLKPYQRVNLIPRSYQLFHKEKLWTTFQLSMSNHGRVPFAFVPQTYIIPRDKEVLKIAMDKRESQLWFVKPPRKSQGKGVRVISKWSEVPLKGSNVVVQEYIKPMLIQERKFDLRIYVLVTSFRPLRAYLYKDGNVRFASMKYSNDTKDLKTRFIHLTNEAVNIKSEFFRKNNNIDGYDGHQWSLRTFWAHLEKKGVDTSSLIRQIEDIVIKTLISVEDPVMKSHHFMKNRYNAYQLFGYDIGIDDQLKPWLFEVNGSPTTTTSSGLLLALKGKLFQELFNIVGYHFPPTLSKEAEEILMRSLGKGVEVDRVTFDPRLYTTAVTPVDNLKHEIFTTTKLNRTQYLTEILESLSPDDIRQLITAGDELSQCDGFKRIFPTRDSNKYFKYFEKPRYYNLLMDAWENKYSEDRQVGIKRLQDFCRTKIHLESNLHPNVNS